MQRHHLIKFFLSVLLISASFAIHGQVVNVEEKRLRNDDGLMGSADLKFNFTKNKNEVIDLKNNIQLSYKRGRHRYLFLNKLEVIKSGDSDVLNNGFQHLRYNYELTKFVTVEGFAQYQFNQIREIDRRILVGGGPRFSLIDGDSIRVNLGIQIIREWEKTDTYHQNFRSSNYLSIFWQINKTLRFISTTYFQPLVDDLDNYRISHESGLLVPISAKFNIEVSYELLYDTHAPEGVPRTMYSFNTGMVYTF